MLGAVDLHAGLHILEQLLPILGQLHIDKVDHDNTAHIAQPQLPCYFFGGIHIYIKGIALLIGRSLRTISAIYIDNMQSLCMLDNDIRSTFKRNGFS